MNQRRRAALFAAISLSILAVTTVDRAAAQQRVERIFREARAYTVRVRTQVTTPFIEDEQTSWTGAGFLIDAQRGWILTNAHVAAKSPASVQVAFVDGVFHPARKVYVDAFTDMAVLQVEGVALGRRVAVLNCGTTPEVGEGVGAFGHPLGMNFTGTRGIVSGWSDQRITDLLQIDATVDHGNSGGPVMTLNDGRIVGIATAMRGHDKSDRVNFATPMRDVCRILDLLRQGIAPEPPHMEFELLVDEDGRYTLEVGHVYNATRWPLVPGDRILAVGREPVQSAHELVSALRGQKGTVPIRIERDGRELEIGATPAFQPSVLAARGLSLDGALIAPIAFHDAALFRDPPGLFVHSVDPGSAAEAEDLEVLDVIVTIDGRSFESLAAVESYVQGRAKDKPMRIIVRRLDLEFGFMAFHVRELPGEEIKVVGPESKLMSSGH